MKWLFLLLSLPILEIFFLFQVNNFIGIYYTLIMIVITAIVGTILVKKQVSKVITNLKTHKGNPMFLISNGLIILTAGICLLTPGFITDTVGFCLLVPKLRKHILRLFSIKVLKNYSI